MSEQADRSKLVRQWVEKAEEDRRSAEHILTIRRHCPYGTVCFHAQQCVEKYIKAALTLNSVSFPKTHDLRKLIGLLPIDLHLPLDLRTAEMLTAYATVLRYPGDWDPPRRKEATRAVEVAAKIRRTIRGYLPKETVAG